MEPAKQPHDPDRTDELPQLDLAAYEAEFDTLDSGDKLSRTDSWMAPGVASLQAARINELEAELRERDAKLHVLRDQVQEADAKQPRLTGELNDILGKIAELEARLHETEGANEVLKKELGTLEARRAELQQQLKLAEAATEQSNAERTRLLAQIAQLNSQLDEARSVAEAERNAAQGRLSEVQDDLTHQKQETVERDEDVAELEADLERARAEAQQLNQTVRRLELKLAGQMEAASRISRSFADQAIRNGIVDRDLIAARAEVERLSAGLKKQQSFAATLDAQLNKARREIDELQGDVTRRQQAIDQATGTLTDRDAHIEQLNAQITERGARIEVLTTQKNELNQSLEEDRAALKNLRDALAAREAEVARTSERLAATQKSADQLRTDLQERVTALQSTEAKLVATEQSLSAVSLERETLAAEGGRLASHVGQLQTQRDQQLETIQRQGGAIQGWEQKWAEAAPRLDSFEAEVGKRDERISALEGDLAKLGQEHAHVTQELEEHRKHVQTLVAQLNIKDQRIASLEGELTAHSNALGVIRRDVDRIESEHAKPPKVSAAYSLVLVDDERVVHLLNRKIMTIGRTDENDIHIPATSISRRHAKLLVGSNAVIAEDCGSTNGSYLNGRRIKRHVLRDGDVLMVGKVRLQFKVKKN